MMKFLRSLFSGPDMGPIKQAIAESALVVDVRTPGEFAGGHFPKAQNIPLNTLPGKVDALKKQQKTIVVCCASGVRSAQAKSILVRAGVTPVLDAGGWVNLM
jgi:phage shock protein E